MGRPPTQLHARANKDTLKLLRLNRVWLCSLNNIAIDVVRAVRRAGGGQRRGDCYLIYRHNERL